MKRYWNILLAVVTFLVACEVLSHAFLRVRYGADASGRLQTELRNMLFLKESVDERTGEKTVANWAEAEVVHPYVGYVRDYDERFRKNLGFDSEQYPIQKRSPEKLVVAVVGGSVAMHAHHDVFLALKQIEDARPAPRQVVLVNLALLGYKQPQQLMAYEFLASLGAEFDAVVNIDGFNEMALSYADNYKNGVFPFYPRDWAVRMSNLCTPEAAAALEQLRRVKARMRACYDAGWASPLSASATVRLGSYLAATWLGGRASALRAELRQQADGMAGFKTQGPRLDLGDEGAFFRSAADVWMRSSLALHNACAAAGTGYFHFLQPNQYVPGTKAMSKEELAGAYAPDTGYAQGVVKGYALLQEGGRAVGEERALQRPDRAFQRRARGHLHRQLLPPQQAGQRHAGRGRGPYGHGRASGDSTPMSVVTDFCGWSAMLGRQARPAPAPTSAARGCCAARGKSL